VLTLPITLKQVQSIAGRNPEVLDRNGTIDLLEFAPRTLGHIGWHAPRLAGQVQLLRLFVGERLDHDCECNASRDTRQSKRCLPNVLRFSG